MNSKELSVGLGCGILMLSSVLAAGEGTRSFPASNGDRLKLDLDAGGEVHIKGSGGSAVSVSYDLACDPDCEIDLDDTGEDLEVRTRPRSSLDDVIDVYKKDIDRTLLRENLKKTPEQVSGTLSGA